MEDRPDLDYSLPRFNIAYLSESGWKTTNWKMTIAYAKKQFEGVKWWPVFPSAEYYDPDQMPVITGTHMSRFMK